MSDLTDEMDTIIDSAMAGSDDGHDRAEVYQILLAYVQAYGHIPTILSMRAKKLTSS